MSQPVWITPAGSIGAYPSTIALQTSVLANPVLPAISITYKIISGSLPNGLSLSLVGIISGTPSLVTKDTTYFFVIRATDNLGNIRDRTFSMIVSGVVNPEFETPGGIIEIIQNQPSINDSIWVEFPIEYTNPVSTNKVSIRVVQGQLPPGLEINEAGLIRGYAKPPSLNRSLGLVVTTALSTSMSTNAITCISTFGFSIGRPVVFTGTTFGNIINGQTYFIKEFAANSFTISTTSNGPILLLENGVGNMTVTLPDISVGQPTIRTFSFTLRLDSEFGSDVETYAITVKNQNTPITEGGNGLSINTRLPTILNTRPTTYDIEQDTTNFGYYLFPNNSGYTYPPSDLAYIGSLTSDNQFSFKILGNDFDGNNLTYEYTNLPLSLVGDPVTGWITGNPIVGNNNISDFSFGVRVFKTDNPTITTDNFNFSFRVTNDLIGDITWLTPQNLGIIENGTMSTLNVVAASDVDLEYRIIEGSLPPNLFLLSNGEISGTVAFQPTNNFLPINSTTDFTVTIQAYSPLHPVVLSSRTFTISVLQAYSQPTDTLYIKCTPSLEDRNLLKSLLENNSLIPNEFLYRSQDSNFGKATSVTYAHAYGIHANYSDAYIESVMKNHYWRNVILGELKTAVAKNDQGDIIYEVVYSQIIDNLVNAQGISIGEEIMWPRPIDLQPGLVGTVYPNSLENMRNRVGSELGQDFNFRLYPKWMTSQQSNGSTLGYIPAWVIAYCKPGTVTLPNGDKITYAQQIKNNIENNWKDPVGYNLRLNEINFRLDRFTVDKSATYNYDTLLDPPAWLGLPSATPVPNPKDEYDFHVLFPRKTILPNQPE